MLSAAAHFHAPVSRGPAGNSVAVPARAWACAAGSGCRGMAACGSFREFMGGLGNHGTDGKAWPQSPNHFVASGGLGPFSR